MEPTQTLEPERKEDEAMLDSDSDSDSDSGSGSDSEDEAQQNLQLESLQGELVANPSNYDAHLQYIKLLRKTGDVDKLSKAREAMSEIFPLSPSMWQEWIKDELSLNTDFSTVLKLYERGVFDYLSVPLWFDYINFVIESDPTVHQSSSPDGISKVRYLFESALSATGLHVSQGSKIWEAYIRYEQGLLDSTVDETAKEKQVQRIRSLFHRQLSVPLADMSSTLIAYKNWEVEQQGGNFHDIESTYPHVASAYQKALEMYNARVRFEEQVSSQDISDSERLQYYMDYLKFEKESTGSTPARIQVLYERAVSDFPISPDLWLDYTGYLDKTLKVGNVVTNVYSRATKNCPWIGQLWVRYLLSLERGLSAEEDLCQVFEKSLQCTFSTLDEYLDLFLTRIDGLRRRIMTSSSGEKDLLLIRETFQRASDYLSPHLKNTECLLHLHAYWARLEAKLGKDVAAARGVWENFVRMCGSMLEAWKCYIAMEVELGHINEARSIYKRCYAKKFSGTVSEDICHSWLRFEREFGTLDDFDHALQKVTPRLEELQLLRIQQESKTAEENYENEPKKKPHDNKRKLGSDITTAEQSSAKRQKDAGRRSPKKAPEENKYQEAQKSSQETTVEGVKNRAYFDECTAFISNLHLSANDENIRNFFSDVGGIVAIRILHDKNTGKSRGLAYVDFSDEEHLAAAVAKNKRMLLGKKLSVARSDPKRGKKESNSDRKTSRGHAHSNNCSGQKSKETDDNNKDVKDAKPGSDSIQLRGKNTFAVPRNVRPLGFTSNKPKSEEGDEKPKSNDEFRKLFIK